MRRTNHPNFYLGIISFIVLVVAVIMYINGYRSGNYILYGAIALGAVHWIWAIIDVFKDLPHGGKGIILWSIVVIAVPPLGGVLFYALSKAIRL